MANLLKIAGVALLALLPTVTLAGPEQFVCTVKSMMLTDDDGRLKTPLQPFAVGKTFTINRSSGIIVGQPFSNQTASEVRVIDSGRSNRDFVLLFVSSPTGRVQTGLLTVSESEKGKKKPFAALDGNISYSGICE